MGFLSRLFGPREPESFDPPSEDFKSVIMLLGVSRNYSGLARSLKSKNPHVRAFTVGAVLFAGHTRSLGGNKIRMSKDFPIDARAVQLLIPLLKDSDQQVREATERALKSVKDNADVARALEEYQASLEAPK